MGLCITRGMTDFFDLFLGSKVGARWRFGEFYCPSANDPLIL